MTDRINDITSLIEREAAVLEPSLIAIRRDIHAHPELGHETPRTSAIVAEELCSIGLAPRTGVGGLGVIADIIGGAGPGPLVLVRADMDALPMDEATGLPFASTIPGRMHACGHDLHTATLLGAGRILAGMAPRLRGSIRLVFQPAEETIDSGAKRMVADGAAEGASIALGFHNMPELAVGKFGYVRGAVFASGDEFGVVVKGRSGHAARPYTALDPIVGAAAIIMQLQTAVSRSVNPAAAPVLTIGQIHGGTAFNIIPETCFLEGTIRCRSTESREIMRKRFHEICEGVSAAMGMTCEINFIRGCPPEVNDDAILDSTIASLERQFGETSLVECPGDYGTEDFAYFTELMPSAHLFVGSSQPGRNDRLHNTDYQPDERCIGFGVSALTRTVMDLLS
ncbi:MULTISPECIES: M20 family metallopeptidase [unclassified Mesorhizobium]|uniref:M20 metallopeptidase family protein n=1 Tax=unclassified Mesorhizobium TaxID=325217 RepID=UPI001091F5D2|nr:MULTISPECIES: M20 family metallopeptidase [unclassified Mesorhizobium]TGS43733.1 amidohydrolase [Mesorhizobium sp. M8A.F.Ca.ET.182.01.1.1]TGS78314.1 amidohydrolase [Mesorhizobium sp. M8A.F.Ca.ET.181.01.1.1]TGV15453.1 amidohydrolase [Mesorhizobium sp. M8A.F.Ca.ET.173.01.1.1]